MPSKNEFPLSGLSKQQKEILNFLNKNGISRKKYISWTIAEIFNNEQDNRIVSRSKTIRKLKEEYLNEDTTPERKKIIAIDLNLLRINSNLADEILTKKHRASMSRSLKRLRERGLIQGYQRIKWDWDTDSIKYKRRAKYVKNIKYYGLTEKGLKYFF